MAANEYDDILGSTSSAQTPDEYDALIDQGRSAQSQALRKSLFEAIKVNPDQYAAAKQAGAATGLPAPIAARNMDTVQPKAQLNSYDALLDSSPKLASALSDPEFAKIAHDDTGNASVFEKTLGMLGRAGRTIGAASYDITGGIIGIPEFGYRSLSDLLDPVLPGDHPLSHVADFVKGLRQGQQYWGNRVQGDISGAGRLETNVLGGVRSTAQILPALAAGALTDNPELTMGIITAQAGGEAASSALDQGLSTDKAGTYALSQAANTYIFGKLPLHGLLGDLANGSGFVKTLTHNLATMVPAVEGQTLVGNLIDWANLNPDKSFNEFASEQPGKLADALVQAVTMSVGSVGVAHAVNRVSQRFAGKMDAANQATTDGETLEAMTQTAADSKIRARDPESFRQFVEAANADGPVQDVYVDARTLMNTLEQAKATPDQLSPSIKAQLAQAVAAGGDVRIPLGEYSSQVAGQDYAQALLPHLRTSPEAMSSAQAQDFYQSHEADFKAEAEKQMAQQQDNSEFHASGNAVEGRVLDQLVHANRFTPDVNQAYASMVKEFYSTQADKLGISPEEMYTRYPLNIRAENVAGEHTLKQEVPTDEQSAEPVAPGKPFLVFRTADRGGLDNSNAGNAHTAAMFLDRLDDIDRAQPAGAEKSDTVFVNSVTHETGFGDVKRFGSGEQLSEGEHGDLVGRKAEGPAVTYSFPKGGKFKSTEVARIPISELRDRVMKDSGESNFSDAGYAEVSKALREIVKELQAPDQEIERRFTEQLSNVDQAIADYSKLKDSEGGRVLNTDTARELSADYMKDRTKSAAVHEPASALVKEMFKRKLAEAKPGDTVTFSAGGTGSGKTSGLNKHGLNTGLVYDTNMNKFAGADAKVQQALAAKQKVSIAYTSRDPVDALVNGALDRAMRQEAKFGSGRTVPMHEHEGTHSGSRAVIAQLVEKYKNDPRVTFKIIDNSHGKDNAKVVKSLADLPKYDYNSIGGKLDEALENEHSAGRISDAVYNGFKRLGSADSGQPESQREGGSGAGRDQRREGEGGRVSGLAGTLHGDGERAGESEDSLSQDARGQISFGSDLASGANLTLLKSADLSTFLHESGHFFLEVYNDLAGRADAPEPIKQDFDTVMKWFGTTDTDWRSMTLDQKRDMHEKFARGFEAYLFEGKSPNVEMQGVFQRFRSWLLNVYKSLSNLHVDLTDEVRGVFGRMLASEGAIHAAEAARSYAPVFESAKQARMTPDEWESYQKLGAEATQDAIQGLEKRSLRDMQWLSNAKSAALKDLQRDATEKRKAVRDEISTEVQQQPVYAAQRFIRHGDLTPEDLNNEQRKISEQAGMVGSKLSLPALKEMYGEGPAAPWRYLKKGKYGDVATEGAMHPDQIAQLFGFSSGDEMVRKMIAADPVREVVEAATDQRMLERYGDLTDPADMARAADREVHNEARARFVATELKALSKATGQKQVLAKAAKEFAAETIARTKVRDLKPAQFTAAEGRAAKAAEAALSNGKLIEAATEKRNQLVNVYAARAAMEAVREIDSGVKYLKKFDKDSTRKALGAEYSDQIDQLLERFDLRKSVTNTQIDKRKSLAKWIESQEANGFEPVLADVVRNDAYRISYKEMPVEQFRGLIDSVRNVEHLGRLKDKLLTAQDGREFGAAVETAKASIDANAKRTIPDSLEHNSISQRLKTGVNEFFAMHRKFASLVREMDGFKDGGPLWELLVRPMNKAGDHEAVAREKATVALSDIFKPVLKEGHMRDKMYIGAIDKSLSREGRLSIALNWGNETNRRRVMEGDKWTPDQVHAILDTLGKSDWDFVQKVWDHIDSYWPQIKAKEERVTGLAPQKVEASPVITKHGEYKGGYYPIKYDPTRSSRSESDTLAESLKDAMRGLYTRATTRRGHIQERVESVDRPMRKDIGVVFEHVNQVIHDLSWHEYLIDANRLLRSSGVDQAVREHYGPESIRLMRSALDDVARGEIPAASAFDRAVNYVRTGATTAGLGWSLSTALLQPIGLTQSMVRIGPGWVAKGLSRWIAGAARMEHTVQMVNDKSEFMRLRAKTMQREINEIRNQVSGDKLGPIKQSFFYLIQKLQMVADMPTWLGQYEKSMASHGDEPKAIAESDQAVIDAQGGGQMKDLSQIQRGGPLMKLWTNFYSFFSTTYNLSVESVNRTNFKKPGDVALLAVDFFLLYSLPAALSSLMHAALQGQDPDKVLPQVARDQLAYLTNSMVGIREISGAVSGFADYNGPAGARIITEVSKLITDAEKGNVGESAARSANNAAGILFHYPAGQVERTARGIVALANGDTSNPGVLIAGPQAKKQ